MPLIILLVAALAVSYFSYKHRDKKSNLAHEKINKEISKIHHKVEKYEKAIKDYYENRLETFYNENIYRKHRGTEKYNESLYSFSLLLNEVPNLIFEGVDSKYYFELVGRKFDLKKQDREANSKIRNLSEKADTSIARKVPVGMENFVPVGEREDTSKQFINKTETIIEGVSNEYNEVEITPKEPQTPFGRKIDWDEVNKHRRELGNQGEEIVYALEKSYLHSINRNDLAEKVKHTSKDIGDGLGYDILSFDENGNEKYIEVKSTSREKSDSFSISQNELNFLKSNKEKAHIYRVLNVDSEELEPFIETYTADEILSSQIEPTQYRIKINEK